MRYNFRSLFLCISTGASLVPIKLIRRLLSNPYLARSLHPAWYFFEVKSKCRSDSLILIEAYQVVMEGCSEADFRDFR